MSRMARTFHYFRDRGAVAADGGQERRTSEPFDGINCSPACSGAGEAAGGPRGHRGSGRAHLPTSFAPSANARFLAQRRRLVMEELRNLDEVGYVRLLPYTGASRTSRRSASKSINLRRHRRRREPSKISCPCCRAMSPATSEMTPDRPDHRFRGPARDRGCCTHGSSLDWPRATVYDGSESRVGCVLVARRRVIGEGWHERPDSARRGVWRCARRALARPGATAYVTSSLAPHGARHRVPMRCWRPASHGWSAPSVDPNHKVAGAVWRDGSPWRLRVGRFAGAASARTHVGFFSRFERRPALRSAEVAMSLDARTRRRPADSLGSPVKRACDVQTWRARSSAVLTGAGTFAATDPALDVRLDYMALDTATVAGVLDSELRCTAGSANI